MNQIRLEAMAHLLASAVLRGVLVLWCVIVTGCAEPAPSCEQMIDALDHHLQTTGIPVPITVAGCEGDAYPADLRQCLASARTQPELEGCALETARQCFANAGDPAAVDACTRRTRNLRDGLAEAIARANHDRGAALAVLRAYERAFDVWAKQHRGKRCPGSLSELGAVPLDGHDRGRVLGAYDPWDSPYEMRCDARDFRVISFGPDRTQGTGDDLDSSVLIGERLVSSQRLP